MRNIQTVPQLVAGAGRSYAALFELLRTELTTDAHRVRVDGYEELRPVVLLLTDGPPTDPEHITSAAFGRLVSDHFRWRSSIGAFGIDQATGDELDKWVFPPIGDPEAISSRVARSDTNFCQYAIDLLLAQVSSLGDPPGSLSEVTERPSSGFVPPDDLDDWLEAPPKPASGSGLARTDVGTIDIGSDDSAWAVPHYLVIDTSEAESEAEASELLRGVWDRTLGSQRVIMEDLQLTSVISFGRDALLVLPLSRDWDATRLAPVPNLAGPPFWKPAFDLLSRRMREDIALLKLSSSRVYRPRIVFVPAARPDDGFGEYAPAIRAALDCGLNWPAYALLEGSTRLPELGALGRHLPTKAVPYGPIVRGLSRDHLEGLDDIYPSDAAEPPRLYWEPDDELSRDVESYFGDADIDE